MTAPRVPLSSQVAAVELLWRHAQSRNLRIRGTTIRAAESELMTERLAAALNTLRVIEANAPKIREIIWGGQ